jgi:hypothetical protein
MEDTVMNFPPFWTQHLCICNSLKLAITRTTAAHFPGHLHNADCISGLSGGAEWDTLDTHVSMVNKVLIQ